MPRRKTLRENKNKEQRRKGEKQKNFHTILKSYCKINKSNKSTLIQLRIPNTKSVHVHVLFCGCGCLYVCAVCVWCMCLCVCVCANVFYLLLLHAESFCCFFHFSSLHCFLQLCVDAFHTIHFFKQFDFLAVCWIIPTLKLYFFCSDFFELLFVGVFYYHYYYSCYYFFAQRGVRMWNVM